jgi:hypothetical protein
MYRNLINGRKEGKALPVTGHGLRIESERNEI